MIKVTIIPKNSNIYQQKIHLNFTTEEFKKVKKDIVSTNQDGSYNMKNGDIVEIYK